MGTYFFAERLKELTAFYTLQTALMLRNDAKLCEREEAVITLLAILASDDAYGELNKDVAEAYRRVRELTPT